MHAQTLELSAISHRACVFDVSSGETCISDISCAKGETLVLWGAFFRSIISPGLESCLIFRVSLVGR